MFVMPVNLKESFARLENLRGRKLVIFLLLLFILFILVGIYVGNIIPLRLKNNETDLETVVSEVSEVEMQQYAGKVVYRDPKFFPMDDVSFLLEDDKGKEIVLLYSKDEKLTVVEGLNVIVFGALKRSNDNMHDILIVDRVVVRNK